MYQGHLASLLLFCTTVANSYLSLPLFFFLSSPHSISFFFLTLLTSHFHGGRTRSEIETKKRVEVKLSFTLQKLKNPFFSSELPPVIMPQMSNLSRDCLRHIRWGSGVAFRGELGFRWDQNPFPIISGGISLGFEWETSMFSFFFFFPRSKRVHFFVQLDVSKSVSYGSAPGEKNQRMAWEHGRGTSRSC